ncbi:MAG: hypothetical protein HY711_05495 [Candidatus Melainabacteria bacterium]|nr:hypothetical protein [Candidatus Melainabacteria bacterium]
MKKFALSTVALAAVLLSSVLPVSAEDAKEMMQNAAMFPVKALGVGAGLVLGTPIAVTRCTASKTREYTGTFADKIGGKEHAVPTAFAMVLSVPFGVLAGTSQGVYYGGKNAIAHGSEKPFSKDSFSLGDLE